MAWQSLIDFLLPAGCVTCRRWIPGGETLQRAPILVCFRCRTRLRSGSWPRCRRCHAPRGTGREVGGGTGAEGCLECRTWLPALSAARYAYTLVSPASDLVHALKYEGWRELADFMGGRMAAAALAPEPEAHPSTAWSAFAAAAVIVAVPTTARRQRSRGYNQAALLADVVAARLGRPVAHRALARTTAGASQTTLSPQRRRENVRGAFAGGAEASRVRARAVILVDDVLTTGATALAAATALTVAGAGEVRLLTFGRALPGRDFSEEAA